MIPRGFAHGFGVLSDKAIFSYKCDNFYAKDYDTGINPLDPFLDIDWKIPNDKMILSEKDKNGVSWADHKIYKAEDHA